MNTLSTPTFEQTILTAIVQEANQIIEEESEGYLGRTAMQKIPYFLKVCGVPLRYRFDVYHYGTFCQPILSDVEELEIDGVVHDRSKNPERYSVYAPGEEMEPFLAAHSGEIKQYRAAIQNVVRALFPWEPDRLELISTLHYVSRQLEATGDRPSRNDVIKRFEEHKEGKFPSDEVRETLNRMASAGLVQMSD